jgi:sirohydrochlorin cobaltochelatase
MKYRADGEVDWGNMWDTFCSLAQDGGAPHRGTLLRGAADVDPEDPTYQRMAGEIARGIAEVSDLVALPAEPGWLRVGCHSPSMARWLAEAIVQENVEARSDGPNLFLPVAARYTIEHEVKNVITVVAKTTHYWAEHLTRETKETLTHDETIDQPVGLLAQWFGRRRLRVFSGDRARRTGTLSG